MIKVRCITHQGNIVEIKISGHAMSDEYGKDLVCAGVSTVIIGVCNTLANHQYLEKGTIEVKPGYVHIYSRSSTKVHQLILETLMTTLMAMEEEYGKFIKITKQEE